MTWRTAFFLLLGILLGHCYSHYARAASIENTFGGLTYHLFDPDDIAPNFSNKLDSSGRLIFTGLVGLGFSSDHNNFRIFMGENSVASLIYGATYSYLWSWSIFSAGPIIGLYQQDDSKFYERGITPISIGFGIVPIVGGELDIKVLKFDFNKYIKLNTIVTPVLLNETISLGAEL